MAKNDGKPYEKFVQRVFQQIKNLEGLTTVKVEPSKVFNGNTVDENGVPIPHQIDVHWTFELQGIEYTTVIQAKDWDYNNQVPQKEMIAFEGIVRDIGNDKTKGIFVARSGFQKGAVSWAKAKGINASELRHIHPVEKANRIETIIVNFTAIMPVIAVTRLDLDAWLSSLTSAQKEELAKNQFGIDANVLKVELEDGTPQGTLLKHITWDIDEKRDLFDLELRFDPALYFDFYSGLPRARLDGLSAKVQLHRHKTEQRIHQPLTHVLRSVTGNESYFVSVEDSGKLVVKLAEGLPPMPKPRPKSTW